MGSKRPAPKADVPSPSKRAKTQSTTPRTQTPVETVPTTTIFTVAYDTPLNRPGTRKEDLIKATLKQDKVVNPWPELPAEEQLIGDYKISPSSAWAAMTVYSNCIITNTTYRKNEYVYIRTPSTDEDALDMKQYWVGRILQIRAKDPQNVYALIAWLYWPEEIPELKGKRKAGRQPHHGMGELVASNWLEVVEVLSFAGHADLSRWDESNDEITTRLYWRQTLDRDSSELSKVRERCVCKGPFNPDPDKSMYICDNTTCGIWLHADCIIKAALVEEWDKIKDESGSQQGKSASQKKQKDPWIGKLAGKLQDGLSEFEVEITDLRSGANKGTKHTRAANCLSCQAKLMR